MPHTISEKQIAVLEKVLKQGLDKLKLEVNAAAQKLLLDYALLLHKWNQTYNLTAVRDLKQIIIRHILDSLAIVPFIHGDTILDVGTGAGLPGIPLSLVLPQKNFVLLDSNSKKIRFLTYLLSVLPFSNVEIVHQRVEDYRPQRKFATIVSRAVTNVEKLVILVKHLRDQDTQVLAMQGKISASSTLQHLGKHVIVHTLQIPSLDAERHLICVTGI